MYRLIIADDEPIIRSGLQASVDWESLGFYVTSVFSCGNDIIDYLKDNPADVLLSDIVMTNGSGLEAAEWIEQNRPEMSVVLFTGYSDFNVACRAVSCRVVKALLSKPTQLSAIKKVFSSIALDISQKKSINQNIGTVQLITDLFHILEGAEPECMTEDTCLAVVSFPAHIETEIPSFCIDGKTVTGFIVHLQECSLAIWPCFPQNLENALSRIQVWATMVFEHHEYGLHSFHSVPEMVAFFNKPRLKSASLSGILSQIDEAFAQEDCPTFINLMEDAANMGMSTENLMLLAEKADILCTALMQKHGITDDGHIHARLAAITANGGNVDALLEWSRNLSSMMRLISNDDAPDPLMNSINRYLAANVNHGVSLQDVASALFYSAGYLSRLVKEKTGMNFNDYLLCFRIERAKKLLTTSQLSLQQIGEKVGYTDTRHFSRMFRRITDMTPSQYRHKYAMEKTYENK